MEVPFLRISVCLLITPLMVIRQNIPNIFPGQAQDAVSLETLTCTLRVVRLC